MLNGLNIMIKKYKVIHQKKVKENYLLGEILWYLIWIGSIDERIYSQYINHKKEKGIKRTTFHEAKPKLQLKTGNPWIKKTQEKEGEIIQDQGGIISFSSEWVELLNIKQYKYGLRIDA